MKLSTSIALSAILLVAATPASAFEVESLPLHLYLASFAAGEAPGVYEEHLVFAVSGAYRFVGISFAHEGWKSVHMFERNRQGVFVFAYPLPVLERGMAARPIGYRLVVDGAWIPDPANPLRARDATSGVMVSLVDAPWRPADRLGSWRLLDSDSRTAHFRFSGAPGYRVTVAGTFNGWDPFVHELVETSAGIYELDLVLPPGEHRYVFWYRGERVPDDLNPARLYDGEGNPVSILEVARR
ncbi:MAG TPA: glycogen-binding domain-containing protein [Spirochaetales bacterium]|nr:glycogen-binding domain-containing protein [Spirochaetales bacterium]